MVTIRDVAKESGFSAATVSIVLNNAPLARYIPATTKGRIQKAAKKLGYRPNVIARFLRSKRSHTIGVMVSDVTDPFCIPILRGIDNVLYHAAYLPILVDIHNQRERFERHLEMLLDRHVEGLIMVANWLFVDINLLGDIEKRNIPAAIIGRELKGSISSVMVDNEAGARLALEHLYSLGHRRVAFIRGPKTLADTVPRWQGIVSFARSVKLRIDSKLIMDLPNSLDPSSSFENGFRLTAALLKRRLRFTALVAFDDLSAFGAIRALEKEGVHVPEECSVIGFDDVAPSMLSIPSLTTIRQPLQAMGASAATSVLEGVDAALEKRGFASSHRKMPPELVVRESTRPASHVS
ncbi:MAG TPA: LacI family DNA-binding transcriptional regulator [Candidatus Acidoferrales bacterium]|nr:LacI family DNA-binding transcriptional regulator [Candidatus Acidoferrales bacterium]